MMAPS
jgi:hypothetical protein